MSNSVKRQTRAVITKAAPATVPNEKPKDSFMDKVLKKSTHTLKILASVMITQRNTGLKTVREIKLRHPLAESIRQGGPEFRAFVHSIEWYGINKGWTWDNPHVATNRVIKNMDDNTLIRYVFGLSKAKNGKMVEMSARAVLRHDEWLIDHLIERGVEVITASQTTIRRYKGTEAHLAYCLNSAKSEELPSLRREIARIRKEIKKMEG